MVPAPADIERHRLRGTRLGYTCSQEQPLEDVVTDALEAWPDVDQDLGDAPVILLGNGASIAVWEAFAYKSLYDVARSAVDHPLDDEDEDLFAEFDTTDFEAVLGALLTARKVGASLALETIHLRERYRSIQLALREAMGRAHPLHEQIAQSTLHALRDAYRRYRVLYTTNYDLLVYWAVMSKGLPAADEFVDFFWTPEAVFDRWDTEVRSLTTTQILYLHGAMHLRRNRTGVTRKETSTGAVSLVSAFTEPFTGEETPLFVTEGASSEKVRRIASSDYLTFALEKLESDDRPLVVLGHALGDWDDHIVKAINEQPGRLVAIGIYSSSGPVRPRKQRLASRLTTTTNVRFFDSTTHPLTSPSLRVAS